MCVVFLKRLIYTGRSALVLLGETIRVTWQRVRRGPLLADWSWTFEVMTCCLRRLERIASAMPAIAEQRLYTDALLFPSLALQKVHRDSITDETVRGCWFTPHARAFVSRTVGRRARGIPLAAGARTGPGTPHRHGRFRRGKSGVGSAASV